MEALDRRGFLRSMVGGAAVVTIATIAATAGVTLLPSVTEAAPVPADKNLPKAMEDFVEDAQYWYGRQASGLSPSLSPRASVVPPLGPLVLSGELPDEGVSTAA